LESVSPEQVLAGLTQQRIAALDRDIEAVTGAIRTRDVQLAALMAANQRESLRLQGLTTQRARLNERLRATP
jgi:hypothetical protein